VVEIAEGEIESADAASVDAADVALVDAAVAAVFVFMMRSLVCSEPEMGALWGCCESKE